MRRQVPHESMSSGCTYICIRLQRTRIARINLKSRAAAANELYPSARSRVSERDIYIVRQRTRKPRDGDMGEERETDRRTNEFVCGVERSENGRDVYMYIVVEHRESDIYKHASEREVDSKAKAIYLVFMWLSWIFLILCFQAGRKLDKSFCCLRRMFVL